MKKQNIILIDDDPINRDCKIDAINDTFKNVNVIWHPDIRYAYNADIIGCDFAIADMSALSSSIIGWNVDINNYLRPYIMFVKKYSSAIHIISSALEAAADIADEANQMLQSEHITVISCGVGTELIETIKKYV